MVRTQIYLSDVEHRGLRKLARQTGKSVSELIRAAVDRLLQPTAKGDRLSLLRQARGLWQERTDLPDFGALRREGDVRRRASRTE